MYSHFFALIHCTGKYMTGMNLMHFHKIMMDVRYFRFIQCDLYWKKNTAQIKLTVMYDSNRKYLKISDYRNIRFQYQINDGWFFLVWYWRYWSVTRCQLWTINLISRLAVMVMIRFGALFLLFAGLFVILIKCYTILLFVFLNKTFTV